MDSWCTNHEVDTAFVGEITVPSELAAGTCGFQIVCPNLRCGDAQGSSTSTPDHVPAATIIMCVTIVAEYVPEQERIHVATSP